MEKRWYKTKTNFKVSFNLKNIVIQIFNETNICFLKLFKA